MSGENTRDLQHLSFPPSFFEDEVREGFFVRGMMKRFWAAQLTVLAEIDRICKTLDIEWFIACGTLLGAVRHGGYVPWDDDMDIMMFRHDLKRFLAMAPAMLPPGFLLNNVETDPAYLNVIPRVQNSAYIDTGKEHLSTFSGCPYTAGVDIFALDGVYEDADRETDRRRRLRDVCMASAYVAGGAEKTDTCRELLDTIERDGHCLQDRKKNLQAQLLRLQNEISGEVSSCETKNIAVFFNAENIREYPSYYFDSCVMLAFEGIYLPAPMAYNAVLQGNFGDYLRPVKGGGAHDYPVWGKQEKMLCDETGKNPFRYTMTAGDMETAQERPMRRIARWTLLLKEAQEKIRQCLEQDDVSGAKMLAEKLRLLSDRLERALAGRGEIVFLVFRASCWSVMSALYEEMIPFAERDVIVIPVPWYEKRADGTKATRHDESALLPRDLPLIMPEEYDITQRMPAAVVTVFPYDGTNYDIDIDEVWYSGNLRIFTDKLIYLPCHEIKGPGKEDTALRTMLRALVEQPAVAYADAVLLPDEDMKLFYLETLTEIMGKNSQNIWRNKLKTVAELSEVLTNNGNV